MLMKRICDRNKRAKNDRMENISPRIFSRYFQKWFFCSKFHQKLVPLDSWTITLELQVNWNYKGWTNMVHEVSDKVSSILGTSTKEKYLLIFLPSNSGWLQHSTGFCWFQTCCGLLCYLVWSLQNDCSENWENVNTRIQAIFLKVDKNEELASEYKVRSMPTSIFIKNRKKLVKFLELMRGKYVQLSTNWSENLFPTFWSSNSSNFVLNYLITFTLSRPIFSYCIKNKASNTIIIFWYNHNFLIQS